MESFKDFCRRTEKEELEEKRKADLPHTKQPPKAQPQSKIESRDPLI